MFLRCEDEYLQCMKDKKKILTQSFVTGVVAFVFLVMGYQTSLFVQSAAVTKIASNRDAPDTVYVYEKEVATNEIVSGDVSVDERVRDEDVRPVQRVVRKNSEHCKVATAVRENLPPKKVESFSFNPNTVSQTDLVRLGFTAKQAASIVNYREKGGKFRRKSDFAKSYVVSDSIYRRLESYIDIPLVDINTADSAEFDTLPGIGGWFAAKMVEYREKLGGYSCKEQLMEIWRFDQDKYDALKDLITLSVDDVEPYPLWTYPIDSLRMHPHISHYETAYSIVLFRENNPIEKWTVDNLATAGILSEEAASRLSRCRIRPPDQ